MALDAQTTTLVEAGSALVVGTVDEHGMPRACRAWGLDVLEAEPDPPGGGGAGGALGGTSAPVARVRLLLDADDPLSLANLATGRSAAITATDVPTLRSVQLKGLVQRVEPAGAADLDRLHHYIDAFYADIERTDGTSRALLERLTPEALVVVRVDVTDVFDQTPGPGAGRCLSPAPGAAGCDDPGDGTPR